MSNPDYPRCLYRGIDISKIVHNDAEKATALAEGYTLTEAEWLDAPAVEAEPAAEAPKPKGKPGRKPKAE